MTMTNDWWDKLGVVGMTMTNGDQTTQKKSMNGLFSVQKENMVKDRGLWGRRRRRRRTRIEMEKVVMKDLHLLYKQPLSEEEMILSVAEEGMFYYFGDPEFSLHFMESKWVYWWEQLVSGTAAFAWPLVEG